LGRSRGGFSTKIHALVDTAGKPLHIEITPGQAHEASVAETLIEHAQGKLFFADTAYDGDRIRACIAKHGMKPVIRPHPCRLTRPRYNRELYKQRHLIEFFYNRLKQFRRIATRYEKTARNYLAMIHVGCIIQWVL
jgi:transposase